MLVGYAKLIVYETSCIPSFIKCSVCKQELGYAYGCFTKRHTVTDSLNKTMKLQGKISLNGCVLMWHFGCFVM